MLTDIAIKQSLGVVHRVASLCTTMDDTAFNGSASVHMADYVD